VARRGSYFYLYYAASSFGTNTPAIGAARTRTPGDLDSWEDLGPILTSDQSVDYNAIDADVFQVNGQWWIAFGSFWDGIKMQRLRGMTEPYGEIVSLARRAPDVQFNPIENPQIFRYGRYYYLMMSWDFCCQGVNSTYRIAVGRSRRAVGARALLPGPPLLRR
jgi:arabinan endo-1,5-alpha-L-arabinosidase